MEEGADMIQKLFMFIIAMSAFGAFLIWISHVLGSKERIGKKLDWIKYIVYLIMISIILILAHFNRTFLMLIFVLIAFLGARELYSNLKASAILKALIAGGLFAAIIILLEQVALLGKNSWYGNFVYMLLLVCISDSFSQLWGRVFGRHKLCKKISPRKTVEGLIGGFLTVTVSAQILSFLIPEIDGSSRFLLGSIIFLAATAGDLLFSMMKRKLKIKDFSGIIPGHGGVLDRFDSLILALPVYCWTMKLIL
jgi:phosphatidate cytidylyltransferase